MFSRLLLIIVTEMIETEDNQTQWIFFKHFAFYHYFVLCFCSIMYSGSFQKLLETKYIVLIYFFLLRISFQHRGTFALVINLVCSVFMNTPMSIYNGIYWFYSFLRLMCTYTNVQNNTNYFSIIQHYQIL